MSPMELKQTKKEYLNLSKLHPPQKTAKSTLGDAFLIFLNKKIEDLEWRLIKYTDLIK